MIDRARELSELVRDWIAADPDPSTRAELQDLLDDPSGSARAELGDRFDARLSFGTAGLRGKVGGGPNRMNRAVVRQTTAALALWLESHDPKARESGVVIGCDARHGSRDFAIEAAGVLAGAGFRVRLLPFQLPTPILAFSVRHLGAAAGIMITASHNPPADNGYKLYLRDGAQIVPPVDEEIEVLIEQGPGRETSIGDLEGPHVDHLGEEVVEAYLGATLKVAAETASMPPLDGPRSGRLDGPRTGPLATPLAVVYTPLHGVALATFEAALSRAGYPPPLVVSSQAAPDPDFPTVAFPNPEIPGALDLAFVEATRADADLVIANDPDGDRLGVAVPDSAEPAGWRALTGDQLGALLGAHVLQVTADLPRPGARLVATTIVSSSLLGKLAADAGAHYAETLTGFKWIARAAEQVPGSRFVFGYEEALGYCVGDAVHDKDGIGAALAFLQLATEARFVGKSIDDLIDDIEIRHGVHLTSQLTVETAEPGSLMKRLRAEPPRSLAGRAVIDVRDFSSGAARTSTGVALPRSDVLSYHLESARVVVRPSGTEPKLKAYFEVVRGVSSGDLRLTRSAARDELNRLEAAAGALLAT